MSESVLVVGAGLAGSEAAWQLARRGIAVELLEMRPHKTTPAHRTARAAELVCTNSFKSDAPEVAAGLLGARLHRQQPAAPEAQVLSLSVGPDDRDWRSHCICSFPTEVEAPVSEH